VLSENSRTKKNGEPIQEFVALKPEIYSAYLKENEKDVSKKAKGIPKSTTKKISHDTYRIGVERPYTKEEEFYTIKSQKHKLTTIKVKKTSLSSYDDKRYYIDLNNSRAIGHKDNK